MRQAQHYCAGNWTVWDNKITTLPGKETNYLKNQDFVNYTKISPAPKRIKILQPFALAPETSYSSGLYILTAVIAHVASAVHGKERIHYCSVEKLRYPLVPSWLLLR